MAGNGIVVWEWQNEFGCWRPYDPSISGFIESNKTSTSPLKLGSVDPSFYQYEIDLQMMCQRRQGTGTQRVVRRTVHPPTSPLAKGITWQWEGDVLGHWNDFDVDVMECLEDCYSKGQALIDLSMSRVCLPYHIDLSKMTQTRVHTGRVRKIQRVFTSCSYPIDLSVSAGASTSINSKRSSGSVNKNLSVKKARTTTICNTSNTTTASSTGSSFLSTGFSYPSSSTNTPYGFPNPLLYPASSGCNSTSNPPSVIQFGQSQGPLTRRRYNHTIAAMGIQGPVGSVIQPSQALPPGSVTNNNNTMANLNVQGAGSSFPLNSTYQSPASAMMYGLYPNQMPVPSHGGFGGLPTLHGPSSQFGYISNPTPSQQSLNYPGSLNPSSVFGGSRSGRVRPSRSSRSSQQNHGRIPNIEKSSDQFNKNVPKFDDIIYNYAVLLNSSPVDEDCCICCEKLQEASSHGTGVPEDHAVVQLEKCSHMFHKLCLEAMYDSGPKEGSLQCPTCKTIYGEKRGNCPAGEMEFHVINTDLPGYEGHKTIQVTYHIPSTTQGPEHPHPGKRFSTRGFPRVGYIPDCGKGRKVLQLLIVAWKRRLTFTIGTSSTTGEDDTVVWNEIHHKTELGTNYSGHGYPDPKYLDNALLELAVHGITEKDLPT